MHFEKHCWERPLLVFHAVIVLLEVEGTSFPSASQQLSSLGREQSVMHRNRKVQLLSDISAAVPSVRVLRVQEDSACELHCTWTHLPLEHGPCCLLVSKRLIKSKSKGKDGLPEGVNVSILLLFKHCCQWFVYRSGWVNCERIISGRTFIFKGGGVERVLIVCPSHCGDYVS